jgi:hypothetical protein
MKGCRMAKIESLPPCARLRSVKQETLARKLGTTHHVSPLLMKARRLGLYSVRDLEQLAFQRGCLYYDPHGSAKALAKHDQYLKAGSSVLREEAVSYGVPSVSAADFSNEELAVALFSPGLPSEQMRLRIGAAMLAADGNSPEKLARLAVRERCETVMRYVSECGKKVEPENRFWDDLLGLLPQTATLEPDRLPHITRFVAMTGVIRKQVGNIMQWIRPSITRAA